MGSKAADSGLRTETFDLGAEEAQNASRDARDGVCLIPYLITALALFGIH